MEDHDASYWRRVPFSDESTFNELGSDGRQYVRRNKDEEFNHRCTVSTLQGGGGSVLIWGVISAHGPEPIDRLDDRINSVKYIDMLDAHFVAYFDDNLEDNPIFMQDNPPIRTAGNVKRFLLRHNIPCVNLPAQSPDFNRIENVCTSNNSYVTIIFVILNCGQKLMKSGTPFHRSSVAN